MTEGSTGDSPRDDDPLPPRTFKTILIVTLTVLCFPFAYTSVQLVMLRGRTTGTVESVGVRRGSHGTSAPKIGFSYRVNGHRYDSDNFSPGLFSGGTWTGGGRSAGDYVVGQSVQVHYDPFHPEKACLAFGWNPWSVGLPLFLIGMGLQGWGGRRGGRLGDIAQVVGWTFAPLGIACFALVHDVVRLSDLPVAFGMGIAFLAVNVLYRSLKGWSQ